MEQTQVPDKPVLTPELREEVRQARRCFVAIERLTSLMMSYPPGHPIVEEAGITASQTFREFFELNDRLSVMIHPHSFKLLGTEEAVWETEDPRDYAWVLSRDGVYLLHILAGIDGDEIRGFVDLLNELADERDLTQNAVTHLFEAGFRYISYDAIDESLAALADIDLDIRDRDTKEEQEAIEELFEDAFDRDAKDKMSPEQAARKHQEEFQVRMEKRGERMQRLQMGSREFLRLTDEQRRHLLELRKGFTEHAELEHREGEILAALLGARPKPRLRAQSVEQIGEVMGTLLETNEPWESLEFLKLIHAWREQFDDETTELLKNAVVECFTQRRVQLLIKLISTGTTEVRRAVLQMLNALHLNEASLELARMLAWDLDDEKREDIVRFLRERSRYGVGFVREALREVPPDKAQPLVDIAKRHLPKSRPVFFELIQNSEPELKAIAIKAVAGHVKANEARKLFGPLLRASNDSVRLTALRGFADAAPEALLPAIAPLFDQKLRDRPEEEVRELAELFVKHGKDKAIARLKELIQVGKLANDAERDLAILLIKVLARNAGPQVVELLDETAKDWKIHGKVRSAAKDLADILQR